MAEEVDLARSAVERLSEDEALRGDLSDFGFGPLLDWGVAAATAYADQATDASQMEQYTARLRGVIRAAVEAAEAARLDDPAALLDFETDQKEKLQAALQALALSDDPDGNAEQIAAILQTGLAKSSGPAATEKISQGVEAGIAAAMENLKAPAATTTPGGSLATPQVAQAKNPVAIPPIASAEATTSTIPATAAPATTEPATNHTTEEKEQTSAIDTVKEGTQRAWNTFTNFFGFSKKDGKIQ